MMKRILGLFVLCVLCVSALAVDNMTRGYTFDGATGLKTGANLEDLVTQATWASGCVATNNADRLFDSTQFALGTDATGTAGTNVIEIKTGGVTTTEILDGTVALADLSDEVLGRIGSTDFSTSMFGYPIVSLTTNMITEAKSGSWGGTELTVASWPNMIDGDVSTHSSTGTVNSSEQTTYYWDLGSKYSGCVWMRFAAQAASAAYSIRVFAAPSVSTALNATFYPSTKWVQNPVTYTSMSNGDGYIDVVLNFVDCRYVGFEAGFSGVTLTGYKVHEFSVYGVTNALSEM